MRRGLADGGVLEHRPQRVERLGRGQRVLRVEPAVAERDVDGPALRPRERDAEEPGAHRRPACRHDAERHAARGARLRDGGLEGGPVEEEAVVARPHRLLRRVLLREDLELELLEERVAGGAVRLAADDRVEVERHRDVAAQDHQPLGEQRLLGVGLQPLAVRRALHLVGVRDHVLDRAELGHEVAGPLVADPGDAGHVVDRVADEGEDVHDPLRLDPPLRLDRLAVEERRPRALPAGVEDHDVVADELEHVLVGGHHHDPEPGGDRLVGERRDHVVGLEARRLDDRQPEGLAHPADVGQLHREVAVHRRPVRLVPGVLLVAERAPRGVEEHGDVLGLLVLQELAQHRREAVGRVRGQAAARGEAADRVERTVELAAAVDEVHRAGARHAPKSYRIPRP